MEFKMFQLKECVELIIDHRGKTPNKLGGEWETQGIPVISAKNVKKGKLVNKNDIKRINEQIYKKWMKEPLKKGDVLLASEGATLGESMVWRENYPVALGQRLYGIRADNHRLYTLFWGLYIRSHKFQNEVKSRSTGTSVLGIKQSELLKTTLSLPEFYVQRYIGDLDDCIQKKINMNESIIKNLEQISQTLFKRWFIDFEFPNEEGQPYKSSGGKMIESELGEIPEGWEVKKLKDLTLQYKDTFNPKKSEEEEVYHYSLPAYDANSYPVVDKVKEIKSNKWIVEDNCVVFSKMNPKTPRVWLIKEKDDLLNVASSEFVVLKNKSEESNFFIYNVCNNQKFTEYLCSNTTGSTNSRQRVTPTIALDFKLAVNEQIISKFSNLVSANGKMILEAAEENKNLEKLRDTLLPKLLSGEIEIPDDLEV